MDPKDIQHVLKSKVRNGQFQITPKINSLMPQRKCGAFKTDDLSCKHRAVLRGGPENVEIQNPPPLLLSEEAFWAPSHQSKQAKSVCCFPRIDRLSPPLALAAPGSIMADVF